MAIHLMLDFCSTMAILEVQYQRPATEQAGAEPELEDLEVTVVQ
jgi:hypothetical protein